MQRDASAWLALVPAALWMALIFALSAQSHPPQPSGTDRIPFFDKVEHFAEYGILGALLFYGLWKARLPAASWSLFAVAAFAAVLAAAYGATDEFHQSLVPFRQADAADLTVDLVGAAVFALSMAWAVSRAPRAAGNRAAPPPEDPR